MKEIIKTSVANAIVPIFIIVVAAILIFVGFRNDKSTDIVVCGANVNKPDAPVIFLQVVTKGTDCPDATRFILKTYDR